MKRTAMNRRGAHPGLLAAVLFLGPLQSGCTVFSDYNEETAEPREAFERGDFKSALTAYKENLEAVNDSLLYTFEAAATAHVGGMYEESIRLFGVAYDKVEEYQDRALMADVGQVAASILVNEKTISYTGAVFEQIMLQAYQARNYYLADKRDGVNVEVRRCYDVIDKARQIYEKELKEAEAEAEKSHEGIDVAGVEQKMREAYDYGDLSNAEDVYEINYVRYLNSFLREAVGFRATDFNDAWVDMKFVADRFGAEEFVRRDMIRLARKAGAGSKASELEREYGIKQPAELGSVAMFFESGMAPRKGEIKVIFPTLHGAAAIAMPKYEFIPNPVSGAVLVVGDQQQRSFTLSNLQSIAYRYHRDRLPLMIAKQIIRLAAKVAIQEGGHAVIANNAGENAALWAGLYSIGTSIWNVASEQADLRAWRTLPQTLQVARVYLPAGQYPAKIILLGANGAPVREMDLGTITVKADKHRMINARSIGTSLFVDVSREKYDAQPAAPTGPTTVVTDLRRPDAEPARPAAGGGESSSSTDLRRPDAQRDEPKAPEERTTSTDVRRPDAEPPAAEPQDPIAPPAEDTTAPPPADDTAKAPADEGSADGLDRLARILKPGHPLCFQVVFDNRGPGKDLAFNTTVDEAREETDSEGRRLVVMTANFEHEGVAHYFSFVIREDGIDQIDLMAAPTGQWEAVPKETFWFKAIPGGELRFEGKGRAIASRRGVCNRARGAKARAQANVYLRTYHVDGASELQY